jgi:hypothetical protein
MERATSADGVAEPAMFRGLDFYPGREHAKMESGAIVLAAKRHNRMATRLLFPTRLPPGWPILNLTR